MDDVTSPAKRTKIACEDCRRNKRKCDGIRPSCTLCSKGRKLCSYAPGINVRKRKYWDEDYVRNLEEQVQTLTALVAASDSVRGEVPGPESSFGFQAMRDKRSSDSEDDGMPQDHTSHSANIDGLFSHEPADADAISPAALDDLGSLMLRMSIEDEGEPCFTISTGSSNLVRPPPPPPEEYLRQGHIPQASEALQVLHDEALRQHLLDCFRLYFNPFHQVFDQGQIKQIRVEDPNLYSPDEHMRILAVLAIGAHFSDQPGSDKIGEQCAEYSERLIHKCFKYHPTDYLVQGLSLLAWRELILGNDSMSYNFNSSATGLALKLGLHVTALNKPDISVSPAIWEVYKRRVRSFWVYFSVDRMVSSILGMNCTMPWQRVRVPPFESILPHQKTVDEVSFCRQGQLWHLWDSFMDQIYAFDWPRLTNSGKVALLSRSQQALSSFHNQSSPLLHVDSRDAAESVVYYQLAFHTATILIHRPFLAEPVGSRILPLALRASTDAALAICRIVRDMLKEPASDVTRSPPHILNYIVCASVIHLLNATGGRTTLGRRSAGNLKICIDALMAMRKRWRFRQEASIAFIRELAHKWKVVWALPIHLSSPLAMDPLGKFTSGQSSSAAVSGMPTYDIWQDPVFGGTMSDIVYYQTAVDHVESAVDTGDSSALGWLFSEEDMALGLATDMPPFG